MTILFLERKSDVDLLAFLVNQVKKEYSFIDIVYDLMQINAGYNSSEVRAAFNKCYIVFPEVPVKTLIELKTRAQNVSDEITEELIAKIRIKNDFAPIPDWMINKGLLPKESDVIIPDPIHFEIGLPEPKDFVDEMMKEIDVQLDESLDCASNPEDKELVKEILLNQYASLSLPQKYELAKNFVELRNQEAMGADVKLFITLGPSCPFVGATLDELDYGGARMFIFNNFEHTEDADDFEIDAELQPVVRKDWFVGYCQQCHLRIRRRWHAVRAPRLFGGWLGCYCSWRCTKSSVIEFDNANPVLLTLCDVYEQEMNNYKILDRIPDEEYPEYLAGILNENKKLLEDNPEINLAMELTLGDVTSIEDVEEVVQPASLETEAEEALVVLNYFYSEDCPVCRNFTPQLEQLVEYTPLPEGKVGKAVSLIKINTDEVDVSSYNVTQVPTVVVIVGGVPKGVFIGDKIRPVVDLVTSLTLRSD